MQVVYLKDGRKCKLISKTDDGKYIVDPFAVYYTSTFEDCEPAHDQYEQFEMLSNQLVQVDKVYIKPPADVIEAECRELLKTGAELQKQYDELNKEYTQLKRSYEQMKGYKTDLSRYIINREELKTAKRLIVWPKDRIEPRIMGGIDAVKIHLHYTIEKWPNQEKVWVYKGYTDQRYHEDSWSSYSEYFDEEYGIKCDLTDDEILAITHERQNKTGRFGASDIVRTPNEWLTPENIERKKGFIDADKVLALQNAEQDLLKAQERLNKLRNDMVVS